MVARVSNFQITNSFIEQIFDTRSALLQKQEEITTGYKVFDASDDPGRAGTIHALQSTVQRLNSHKERISFALNMLQTQENVVTEANDILVRAKELATQAANGSCSAEVRAQIADEVYQLRDALASVANTKHQGVYIYGGLSDGDAPFDLDPDPSNLFYDLPNDASRPESTHWQFDDPAVESGQTSTRTINISDTDSIRINTAGNEVFEDALNAMEILGRALKGYRTELDVNGDPDGSGTAYTQPADYAEQTEDIGLAIQKLDTARVNHIAVELSSIGARINRLDETTQILDTLKLNTEEARSSIQDTDVFEAATIFNNLQISLQGLLASGTRIEGLSLLNYI